MAVFIHRYLLVGIELGFVNQPAPRTIQLSQVMRSRCPACGEESLYQSVLALRSRCNACGLDFSGADAGDGPAFFAIIFVGFLVTFCAAIVEYRYAPPYVVHAILWLPLTLVLSLGVLRLVKSYLVHAAYCVQRLKKD